jgi:hypothetical protein
MILYGPEPDWFQTPKELGKEMIRVQNIYFSPTCPCGKESTKIYVLKKKFIVAECTNLGWAFRKKPPTFKGMQKMIEEMQLLKLT